MNEIKYMNLAINEAKKAYQQDDVPVGAVIVQNNRVISKAHNQRELKKNVLQHAELIAIDKACKKLNSWHLDNCILFTTLEPCLMCMGAILQSRIKKVYYAVNSEKYGSTQYLKDQKQLKINMHSGLCKKESIQLLKNFFLEKRN